jgi:release factor glutamine methyltransferase
MADYSEIVYEYLTANERLPAVYTFTFKELTFVGLNTVFSPVIFEDTFFFCENVPVKAGDEVLEIGCGTGMIAVCLALKGARVIATDINPDALINTKVNSILNHVEQQVNVFLSDVFASISSSIKFDVIFWNTPFIYRSAAKLNLLEASVFDPEYRSITQYISKITTYLKENGRAFLGFSSSSGNAKLLHQICAEHNINIRLYAQSFLGGEGGADAFSVELYELIVT